MVMLLYFYYSIKLAMHVRLFIGKKHYDIVLLHVHVCGHVIFNMTTYKVHEYINVYLIIMLQLQVCVLPCTYAQIYQYKHTFLLLF